MKNLKKETIHTLRHIIQEEDERVKTSLKEFRRIVVTADLNNNEVVVKTNVGIAREIGNYLRGSSDKCIRDLGGQILSKLNPNFP